MSKLVITVASSPLARQYLERSVQLGVPFATVAGHPAIAPILKAVEDHTTDSRVRMWGSVAGSDQRHFATWNRIEPGDWIVFSIDGRFRLAGRIYARLDSAELADSVWPPDLDAGSYQYLTFFDALTPIAVSPRAMSSALGYGAGYIYRGFLLPSQQAQDLLVSSYGSVEGFLGLLADEQTALDGLAGGSAGSGYVSDLGEFDTAESEVRLEDALREHLKTDSPESVESKIRRIKRDRRLVQKLKELYSGQCQRCGFTFTKRDGNPYSEAAHINRIADRLPGIDSPNNLVVLCANCHRMLDYGGLEIYWDDATQAAMARVDGEAWPLAANKHIRKVWAPAVEWASVSKTAP